jgi:hypothetical protein
VKLKNTHVGTQVKMQNPEKTVLKEERFRGGGETTNLSQRHRQLSSILIPTSQQFDTEWFFFVLFCFVFLLLQSKSQLKSSPQSSPPPSSSSNKFCEFKNPESEEIQRASSHTQGTNEQTNKQGGKKIPVENPRNTGNS